MIATNNCEHFKNAITKDFNSRQFYDKCLKLKKTDILDGYLTYIKEPTESSQWLCLAHLKCLQARLPQLVGYTQVVTLTSWSPPGLLTLGLLTWGTACDLDQVRVPPEMLVTTFDQHLRWYPDLICL